MTVLCATVRMMHTHRKELISPMSFYLMRNIESYGGRMVEGARLRR